MGIVERKEREREARREAIVDAAEVVFKSKGFANATMEDIARQAELAKGTIYLYYKSKEELQIGLVMRGLEMMSEHFQLAAESASTAFDKLLTMGDAYWQFATTKPFYFATMHLMDVPQSEGQISEETLRALHERTNTVWSKMVALIEASKREGMVRAEVDAFTFSILLWMNTTSTLRFHHKILTTPNNAWDGKEAEFNPCNVDFRKLYDLNAGMLFHQIVTEKGRGILPPINWQKSPSSSSRIPNFNAELQPFAEEFTMRELLDNSSL